MKKEQLRWQLEETEAARGGMEKRALAAERRVQRLEKELEVVKSTWRPVPMVHEWQPKNPQCALCDEPRDAARHRVGES